MLALLNTKLKRIEELELLINELANIDVIKNIELDQSNYKFTFKRQMIKDFMWEAGSILELHTY